MIQRTPSSHLLTDTTDLSHPFVSSWRARGIAALRIAFGLIWLVAAWLKWQPDFISGFSQMISGAADGQPGPVKSWIAMWAALIKISPSFFAYTSASIETAIAICLLLGLFSNLTYVVGIVYTLGIWSVAEGFGGPYVPGQSTDVGTALPYTVIFILLLCVAAGRYFSLDQRLTPRLGRWGFLASAPSGEKKR